MRGWREWLGVVFAAAATLYGAYLARGWQPPVTTPPWERPYLDILYLDLFSVLGQWVTVGLLAMLTLLLAGLIIRRRRAGAETPVAAEPPAPVAPPPAAAPAPPPAPVAPTVSPDRIARVVGAWGMPAGLRTLPAAELTPAERMLAEALAQIQRERSGLLEPVPPRKPPSLRLVPQVPAREPATAAAWFGGGARLPEGVAWPEIDGEALQLLAQLDCRHFPVDLWGGIGPRDGWLAMFLGPRSLKPRVLYFTEAGPFQPSPAALADSNMVHPDMWPSEGANRPAAIPAFPRWPVDIVMVEDGQAEPRRPGRARNIGRLDYLDLAEPRFQPFDWPSMQMLMQLALKGYELSLQAPEAALAPDGPSVLDKLRDLAGAAKLMADTTPFSPELASAILAETRLMPAFLPRNAPKLNAKPAFSQERTAEPNGWQVAYVRYLQDRAKHIHAARSGRLPAPLAAHCEEVWTGWAQHEMGAIGHQPWAKLRNFEEKDEVVLLELPSSQLMNWHFGAGASLVLTIRKEDLALGEFGRVGVQVAS